MIIRKLIREILLTEAEEEDGRVGTAATAIFNEQGEVLLVRRSKTAPWRPLHWSLPGGVVDGSETTHEAAEREVLEEVSLTILSSRSLGVVTSDEGWSIEYFYAGPGDWMGDVELQETEGILENDKYAWVKPEDLDRFPLVPTLLVGISRALKLYKHSMVNPLK